MTRKKDKSLFGSLFSKNEGSNTENQDTSQDKELLTCLHNLSTICEGNGPKVDREISQFKKMIKIGSTVSELQIQISVIAKAVSLAATLPENNKLLKLFKQMPADILIDEFISQSTSSAIKVRLQNYRNSVSSNTLAISCINDLIEVFEIPDELPVPQSVPVEGSIPTTGIVNEDLQQLTIPLLKLFTQLELSPEQDEHLVHMHKRSTELNNLDDLSLFLEEVSQLILSSIASCTSQFETFLIQLRMRLDVVSKCIVSNGETNEAISKVSDAFSQCINDQVGDIKTSFEDADNILELENLISKSLESIKEGVNLFDSDRKELEEQSAKTIADLQHELKQTRSETDYLKDNLQQQRNKALTDPLTQLPNRHAYNERLHLEYNRWRRYKKPLSLVMGDIDLFKDINDTHGHIAGDTALKQTAQIIQQSIRGTDFAARFGGEEFVILMPETLLTDATKAINKMRTLIQDNTIHEGAADFKLTMSFGVANFEDDDTFKNVLERADKALYRAKSKGRNQVCVQRQKN